MERITALTFRHCLRTTPSILRCSRANFPSLPAVRCIATARKQWTEPKLSTSTQSALRNRYLGCEKSRLYSNASTTSTSTQSPIAESTPSAAEAVTPPSLKPPTDISTAELEIFQLLAKELVPTELSVKDISGGCGSMYGIEVVSSVFNGLGVLKQQRLVNATLGDRVKEWHGVQLRTKGTS